MCIGCCCFPNKEKWKSTTTVLAIPAEYMALITEKDGKGCGRIEHKTNTVIYVDTKKIKHGKDNVWLSITGNPSAVAAAREMIQAELHSEDDSSAN
ncbi:Oidioi.mRNA.OKI2018_I69.chr2.g6290.t1.cds [Oikopleura dioica]|uniref:Oidioi.mRNA.OKI2018_I69.chr2.g6290.t1.cds n=1 Tax=Oikopleura dioica TaxID=34765 RepID=A0ABN7T349_OIKDI|nr:Oidioi.mRNA.OKI2018_I69.chr2.g6290.t1.cds [Oikopleura dioica]